MQGMEYLKPAVSQGTCGGFWWCVTCRHLALPCSASWGGVLATPQTCPDLPVSAASSHLGSPELVPMATVLFHPVEAHRSLDMEWILVAHAQAPPRPEKSLLGLGLHKQHLG